MTTPNIHICSHTEYQVEDAEGEFVLQTPDRDYAYGIVGRAWELRSEVWEVFEACGDECEA